MIIKDLIVQVYDIEIFPNCFSLTIKNTETKEFQFFELSNRKNNLVDLVPLFLDKRYIKIYLNSYKLCVLENLQR